MEDKNPLNGYWKPSFHIRNISNIQMWHNMRFSNRLDTANCSPLPPLNNVGMNKHFKNRVKCTGVHKPQHCLGTSGKGLKIEVDRVNCHKNFDLHCCSPPPPQKKKNAQQLSSMCLDDCNTLEKSKTMVMQILVSTQAQGALWSICKWWIAISRNNHYFVFFSRVSHYGSFKCLPTQTLTLFSISACWYKQRVF